MRGEYDPHLPNSLRETQQWFASIISRPMDVESHINPIAPSGRPIAEEAPTQICASPTLQPHQRIELYCQQYWWRLLGVLHENLPCVTRLFGYAAFNQEIGIPYLAKYPPNHWSLSKLADRVPQWIREEYRGEDKALVLETARIDCGYMHAFGAAHLPTLAMPKDGSALEALLEQPLCHQPHLQLFALKCRYFQFRDQLVLNEDGDYWLDREFPSLEKKKSYVVLYRHCPHNWLAWKELSPAAYNYLSCFKQGLSIQHSLQWIEAQKGRESEEMITNLRSWLEEWIGLEWLAHKS